MPGAVLFPWCFSGTETALRLPFENAPVGIAQCDRQGTVLEMNPALSHMLAGKLEFLDHPSFSDLIPMEDRDRNAEIFRQLMSGERTSFQIEGRLSCSGDAAMWVRWTAWGVCGSAHNPDCVLLLAEDITEIREREQRAAQKDRLQALGRMAGSVAHDFNNLLTGILLYCDLMTSCLPGDGQAENCEDPSEDRPSEDRPTGGVRAGRERLRKYGEEIRSACLQAAGVVQQLLSVTRPRNANPRPLSLNATADGMRNLLLRVIGEKVELCFHLDPRLGLVTMDSAQAQQVLLNLVLNARDAMPQGGRIQVETGNCSVQIFRDGVIGEGRIAIIPCVLFVISDNGAGMEEETRQRVFQSYFTTKEEGRGSGLGLAIVHDIVAGCGGLVQIDSALGRGTRVTVLLPSVCAPAISSAPEEGSMQVA